MRWSRRKQEADGGEALPPDDRSSLRQAVTRPATSRRPEFDLQTCRRSIPSMRSPTSALSFARAFRPELSRAALRRAWSADPAIRDFVGLAENAWDFTDPNAMPGFGPLEAPMIAGWSPRSCRASGEASATSAKLAGTRQ